jgi:phosphomannomutase
MQAPIDPAIFKSYDVRGIYPSELREDVAYAIGRCFAPLIGAKNIAIGRDMRPSGDGLMQALARGSIESGANVTDLGLVSTDALYFAVGKLGFDGGIMITASHNPAQYNGLKFARSEAQAMSLQTGLGDLRDRVLDGNLPPKAATPGSIAHLAILDAFADHCLSFIDIGKIRPLRVAVDAGNGMAGKTVPYVFKKLPVELVPLYFELDGRFPNHPASPIDPENMIDLQAAVKAHRCDLGVAFDGDADRMFIVDEHGALVDGSTVTALVALAMLERYPGSRIVYNAIVSKSVAELIERAGGIAIRSKVGHSMIKPLMREERAVFGGEHSGHFYFRDNWYADSGMIAFLICLERFCVLGKPVSEAIAPLDSRYRSGEINRRATDAAAALRVIEERYTGAQIDRLDGLTVSFPDWWFNVRSSNTEPVLRLNVEADTRELMERRRDELLAQLLECAAGRNEVMPD